MLGEVERNSEIIQAQVDKNLLFSLTCGSQFQFLNSVGLARTACGNQGARKETSERRNLKGRKIVEHRQKESREGKSLGGGLSREGWED